MQLLLAVQQALDAKQGDLQTVWKQSAEAVYKGTPLTAQDLQLVCYPGTFLGQTDCENQARQFQYLETRLQVQLQEADRILCRSAAGSRAAVRRAVKGEKMSFDVDVLFKIAAIGIAIALLNQILTKAGREEEAMMTTLAGVIIVLAIIIKMISEFFDTVKVFLTF